MNRVTDEEEMLRRAIAMSLAEEEELKGEPSTKAACKKNKPVTCYLSADADTEMPPLGEEEENEEEMLRRAIAMSLEE